MFPELFCLRCSMKASNRLCGIRCARGPSRFHGILWCRSVCRLQSGGFVACIGHWG